MEKGVYLPSPYADSTLLVNSLQVLLEVYPSIKFTSIKFDEKLCGYKIHFSKPDEAVVLEKNYLAVRGRHIWIYPLTTVLVTRFSRTLKKELEDALYDEFGERPVISVRNGDFYIEIGIPEFKGLPVFHEENFSSIVVTLPTSKEKLKLTLWCRHCKNTGHFQHECELKAHPEKSTENQVRRLQVKMIRCEENSEEKSPLRNTQAQSTSSSPARDRNTQTQSTSSSPARDRNTQSTSSSPTRDPVAGPSKFTQKSINSIAEEIGRETVLNSGIISEENLNTGQTRRNEPISSTPEAPNHVLTDREIKKENGVHDNEQEENGLLTNKSDNSVNSKAHRTSVIPKEEPRDRMNEDSLNSFDEDEIQVIGYSSKSSPVSLSHDSSTAGKADGAYNSEDDSRSPPATKSNFSFPSFGETEPFTPSAPGPSNRNYNSKPVSRVEVTSVLSDRLQQCINNACDTCKILDRKTLDAFLIHVKKKSNPVRVALNFTKNPDGLKEQLQKILHMYYNTPQTGTKEDMQFIKWLNGLVSRFDGTIPRKRKRNEQSFDESPTKK